MADAERQAPRTVLVFAGGGDVDADALQDLPVDVPAIAADSGFDTARRLGRPVTRLVGDLDSISPEGLDTAEREVPVERHPTDKDATDLELALDAARALGAERVVVVGGDGGRLDHHLANALLLAGPQLADLDVEWRAGKARAYVVRGRRRLPATPGELVSLIPIWGAARGVSTEGLRWRLDDDTLEPGRTRGVSNVAEGPEIEVAVGDGTLLVVFPGERAPSEDRHPQPPDGTDATADA